MSAIRVWGPAALQMAIIFALSSMPDLGSLPLGLTDHTGHALGYALLGAAMLRGFAAATWEGVTPRAGGLAWAASAVYGATDELHQLRVPGRMSTVDDWLADVVGAGVAIVVLLVVARRRRGPARGV